MNGNYYDKQGKLIDFYSIFNIPYHAPEGDIKSAFRSLIKRYHPDTGGLTGADVTDKIDIIIQGYRVLADLSSRTEYDRLLFQRAEPGPMSYPVIPPRRIKYSASLGEMLKSRFLPRKIRHRDILLNFGQDIEIIVTPVESRRGAVAYIALPSRMHCPYCSGRNAQCHVCRGIGRIATTSRLEVTIPPDVRDNTVIDVDLLRLRPDSLTHFRARSIRIRIRVAE